MLFRTATHDVVEATRADVASLQAFLEANPGYTMLIEGRPVQPDAARAEFDDLPPATLGYRSVRHLLVRERAGAALDGWIQIVEDLLAPGVWHIGLFLVAEARHGSGLAQALHAALEAWAIEGGARWLRLGVAAINGRGARFWRRQGYAYVCSRDVEAGGGRVNEIWVLVKPLPGEDLAGYLAAQARDALAAAPPRWDTLVSAR